MKGGGWTSGAVLWQLTRRAAQQRVVEITRMGSISVVGRTRFSK
jgi:hypothetical protein